MGGAEPDEKSLFNAARRFGSPEARRRYLADVCGVDRDLLARVEALLRVHDEDRTFLRSPTVEFDDSFGDQADEAPGAVIGPYRLLSQLGEGGMGVVYLAEQSQPVRRQVALKLIRPGTASRHVLARFEVERRALALMDHPNIAKVLDADATPAGRSYFVMELVRGVPITTYCDEHRLTPRQRLGLFVQVCRGVQHAHQKGVVHRDLKPNNVLVTAYDGKPVPKIIDFGLAKATGRRSPDSTVVTQQGLVVGTPEYMSPEQADPGQDDIDTRSDVYSLGVLLYELLTGTTPLTRERVKGAGLAEVLLRIGGEESPRPSVRLGHSPNLSATAAARGVEPGRLVGLVRGDLDWIALKCLEKDRGRRYETVDGLARDVERFLRHEPVEASPPGVGYRLRKFARRHRAALAVAAAFVLLLVGGAAVSIWQAVRATAAEREAVAERDLKEEARRQARQALNKLTDETVERLMARQARLTAEDREFLRQVLALHEEFAGAQGDSPESRAGVADARFRVGLIRHRLGEHNEAEEAYAGAIDLQRKLADEFPDRPDYRRDLARSHVSLNNLLRETSRPGQAEQACTAAIGLLVQLTDEFPDRPDYRRDLAAGHNNLGVVLIATNRPRQAEEAWVTAVDILRKLVADSPARSDYRGLLAASYQNLGNVRFGTGRAGDAKDCYVAGRDLFQNLADEFPDRPDYRRDLAKCHNNLGALYDEMRRPGEAEEAFRAAVASQKKLAADFPTQPEYRFLLTQSYNNLGNLLRDQRRPRQAEEEFLAARDVVVRLATDFPAVSDYQILLAATFERLALLKAADRDHTSARQLLDRALPHYQAALRANSKDPSYRQAYSIYLGTSAQVFGSLGDHAQAAAAADELARFAYAPAEDAYTAAWIVVRCVALAREDSRLTEAEHAELTRSYADRAVAHLQAAVRHGFKNGARVRKERAFDPLRSRDDFREVLRELDAAPSRP